jgi:hypothetical protein
MSLTGKQTNEKHPQTAEFAGAMRTQPSPEDRPSLKRTVLGRVNIEHTT